MKALSIKQPFAELILQGKKKIELRKWNTKFRGDFYIHSSLKPHKEGMQKFGFSELPCGFLVGKAELIGVKKYQNAEEHAKDRLLHLASTFFGNYGFVLENPKRIKPIHYKGKLNFFEIDLQKEKDI